MLCTEVYISGDGDEYAGSFSGDPFSAASNTAVQVLVDVREIEGVTELTV